MHHAQTYRHHRRRAVDQRKPERRPDTPRLRGHDLRRPALGPGGARWPPARPRDHRRRPRRRARGRVRASAEFPAAQTNNPG